MRSQFDGPKERRSEDEKVLRDRYRFIWTVLAGAAAIGLCAAGLAFYGHI